MFAINKKTLVCFLIVSILIIGAGFGGLVVGFNGRNFLPIFWLSYFPKIGAESILPVEFDKKPIKSVFLNVEGKLQSILTDQIVVENNGETIILKKDNDFRTFKIKAQRPMRKGEALQLLPPSKPVEVEDVKTGDYVLATVKVAKEDLVVVSLMVIY